MQERSKGAAQPTRICNCFALLSDAQAALGCLWTGEISLQLFLPFFYFKLITSSLFFFCPNDGHIHPYLTWEALQSKGRSSTTFPGHCATRDGEILKTKQNKRLDFTDGIKEERRN